MNQEVNDLIEEATLAFTMGDNAEALEMTERVLEQVPGSFEAWHVKTEIHFAEKDYSKALQAAEKAEAINPEDLHIHTSLSRIYMELGDKQKAEQYGARARMLSWKEELKNPAPPA